MAPADCSAATMRGASMLGFGTNGTIRAFVTARSPRSRDIHQPDSTPVNRPSLVQPVDGRPVVSTGVGITLVVAGAIMHFAVTATFAHVAGVLVMLAGVFALLLTFLVWGPLARRLRRRHPLRHQG
jgi:hypothetical protein